MNLLKILAFAILVIPVGAMARVEVPTPIVVVFEPQAKGLDVDPGLPDRLADLVANRVAETGTFRVVPRSQVRERLWQVKADAYRDCFDTGCQVEIGRELAADHSLAGQVLKLGQVCTFTLDLYDLSSATSVRAASADGGCGPQALADSARKAVALLLAPARSVPVESMAEVPEVSLVAAPAGPAELSASAATLPSTRERGWIVQLDTAYGYSYFSDLSRDNDLSGFTMDLRAGYRFKWITPEIVGVLHMGERDYMTEAGDFRPAFVTGGGLLTGASGMWTYDGFLELEAGLHMGFAAIDPPGDNSYGNFGLRTHLAARLVGDQLGFGVELGYLTCLDHWHMLTVGLTFSLGI